MSVAIPAAGNPPHPGARARQARTKVVKALRRALPGAALLLVLACIGQAIFRGAADPQLSAKPIDNSEMTRPSFSGKSTTGRSYVISGREARRDTKGGELIMIDQPVLRLRDARNKQTIMTSRTGVYDEKGAKLLLKGDVRVDDGSGSRFRSEQAVVDTHTGAVSGQQGLEVQGPSGEIQSQDYTVLNEGDRMILKGGVRGRLVPNK